MSPPVRWTKMDSPVKPANDEEAGGMEGARASPPPASPSGLTGGSMGPPARWAQMDSPVEPANDDDAGGMEGARVSPHHRHPPA